MYLACEKLETVIYAKEHGNKSVVLFLIVNKKQVRNWQKAKAGL